MTQVTIDKNNGNVMKEEDKKLSENSSSEDEKTQRIYRGYLKKNL